MPVWYMAQDTVRLQKLCAQLASNDDSVKFEIHDKIGSEWMGVNLDSPLYHADKMLDIANAQKDPVLRRRAYIQKGIAHGYL